MHVFWGLGRSFPDIWHHLAAWKDSVALPRVQVCCKGGAQKPGGLGVQINPHPRFLQPPKGQGHLIPGREPPAPATTGHDSELATGGCACHPGAVGAGRKPSKGACRPQWGLL